MILGAILGLAGSFIPEIIKIFKSRLEHKQELELFEMQLKYQKEMSEIKMQEARLLAQIELDKQVYQYAPITEIKVTGKTWLDALQVFANVYNQTVRPTITYIVIGAWLALKFAMWQQAGGTLEAIPKVWTEYESDFVSAIITFWFGSRAMMRTFGKVK
jgi:hypothetical protein